MRRGIESLMKSPRMGSESSGSKLRPRGRGGPVAPARGRALSRARPVAYSGNAFSQAGSLRPDRSCSRRWCRRIDRIRTWLRDVLLFFVLLFGQVDIFAVVLFVFF